VRLPAIWPKNPRGTLKTNPLVEDDHGPAIATLPSSQVAGSFSQRVQTMAAFGAGNEGIPSLSGTGQNDVTNPAVLAANLFHRHA
jgi:hypothetical protein